MGGWFPNMGEAAKGARLEEGNGSVGIDPLASMKIDHCLIHGCVEQDWLTSLPLAASSCEDVGGKGVPGR